MRREVLWAIVQFKRTTLLLLFFLLVANVTVWSLYHFKRQPALDEARTRWMVLRSAGAVNDPRAQVVRFERDSADLANFRQRIPLSGELTNILGEIFQTIADNGLQVETITYKPQFLEKHRLWAYLVTLSLEGDYRSLKYLVDDFQRTNSMLIVDNIQLTGSQDKDTVSLGLELTFYLREDVK